MSKVCKRCGIEKEISLFSPLPRNKTRTKASCKECESTRLANWYKDNQDKQYVYGKRWRDANPDKVRNSKLRCRYGISVDKYSEMATVQEHRCAICLRLCEPSDGRVNLVVDHCHDTGVVRELLCIHCNHALGSIGDNAEVALRMASYLDKHKSSTLGGGT